MWPFTPYSLSSSVSGSILWSSPPLIGWSPAFLRRASANPFGSKVPTLRQAEQKPSGEVVTQLQGKRFEAHARSQGTPTLVSLLVLGHSKASLQSSTPNTRPATLVPCAPCDSTLEVAPTVPTHLDPSPAGPGCPSSRSTGGGGLEVPDGRYHCNVEVGTYTTYRPLYTPSTSSSARTTAIPSSYIISFGRTPRGISPHRQTQLRLRTLVTIPGTSLLQL